MIKTLIYKILLNKSVKTLFIGLPKRRKIQYFFLIILFIIQSFAELLSIGSVIPFITAISRPGILLEKVQEYETLKNNAYFQTETQLIIISFLIFLFLIIFAAIIRIFTLYSNYKISFMSGYEISVSLFNKTINQNLSFFNKNDSSIITSFITEKLNLCAECLMHYFTILNTTILIFIVFIALLILNPVSTLFVFLFFILTYLIIVFLFRKKVQTNSLIAAKMDTQIIKLLREAIENIKIIIIHKLQNHYLDIFSDFKLKKDKTRISNLSIASLPKIFMETIAIILLSTIAIVFILYSQSDFISILPYFAIIVLAGQKLLPIIQQLYFSYSALLSDSESVKEVTDFFNNNDYQVYNLYKEEKLEFKNNIEFNNVNFDYGHNKFELKNINISFKKGEKIGIVGSSGSGKSTFIDLLMGLIEPKNGKVKIDDNTLTYKNISNWHSNISHIPQNTFLTNNTIYENIAFGYKKHHINRELVVKIIKKLKLENLINLMESGYETKVGEKGNNISGGQRQKIAFARAFYRNFDVLVIDEGTSSMDNISEEIIYDELYKLENKTIFIVSHRLAFLKKCDYIVEFNNGQITNTGTFSELMNKSSIFRELAKNTK